MFLRIYQPAPIFSGTVVFNRNIKFMSLDNFKGKYVVLFFHPLDYIVVGPTELLKFSDRAGEFDAIDCQLIAVWCDCQFGHLARVNTPRYKGGLGNVKILLLADKDASIAKDYQVYDKATGILHRGLFIIDREGRLRQIIINDLAVGHSVDVILDIVRALQNVDDNKKDVIT